MLVRESLKKHINEWHQDDVTGFAFALHLFLDFDPDQEYIKEVKSLAKADNAYVIKGNTIVLEWHGGYGPNLAKRFVKNNYLM